VKLFSHSLYIIILGAPEGDALGALDGIAFATLDDIPFAALEGIAFDTVGEASAFGTVGAVVTGAADEAEAMVAAALAASALDFASLLCFAFAAAFPSSARRPDSDCFPPRPLDPSPLLDFPPLGAEARSLQICGVQLASNLSPRSRLWVDSLR